MDPSSDGDASKRRATSEQAAAQPAFAGRGAAKKRKAGLPTSERTVSTSESPVNAELVSKDSPASGQTHLEEPPQAHEAPETIASTATREPLQTSDPAGVSPSSAAAPPSLEDLLQLIKAHPDREAAVQIALSAVQRLKRAAPSTSTGSQPGGATKRAATHVVTHAEDASALAQKLARSRVHGSPADSNSASSGRAQASDSQHEHRDDPSGATSRLPGAGQDESSTHGPTVQAPRVGVDASPQASPDSSAVPLLGQLSLQAGIDSKQQALSAEDAPQVAAGPDQHAGDSAAAEGSGSQGRASRAKKARSQVPAAPVQGAAGPVASSAAQVDVLQTVSGRERCAPQSSAAAEGPQPSASSGAQQPAEEPQTTFSFPLPISDAAAAEAADGVLPDMATYLDAYPRAKDLIYAVRGTPNNSTKTPLALVNEYAARLTMEVLWKEDSDSLAGPYTATCTLKSRLGSPPDASGTGRGRNKRDARQVAAAACMELLLGPQFNLQVADFVPQAKPPAPAHSAKRDIFRHTGNGNNGALKWGGMKKMREDQGHSSSRPMPGYTRSMSGHGQASYQRREADMQLRSPRGTGPPYRRGLPAPGPMHQAPSHQHSSYQPHPQLPLDGPARPLGFGPGAAGMQGYGTGALRSGGPLAPVRDSGTPNALSMHSLQAILPAAFEIGLGGLQSYQLDTLGVAGTNTGALDLSGLHGSLEAARMSSVQAPVHVGGSTGSVPPWAQQGMSGQPQTSHASAALLAGLPLSYGMDLPAQPPLSMPPRSPHDPGPQEPLGPAMYDHAARQPPLPTGPLSSFRSPSPSLSALRDATQQQPPDVFGSVSKGPEASDTPNALPGAAAAGHPSTSWSPWSPSVWGPNAAAGGKYTWPE